MRGNRVVIGLAWLLYVASWFLQVIKDGTTLSQGKLPGMEAFFTALLLEGFEGPPMIGIIYRLSALSNLLMIASPIIFSTRFDKLNRFLPWLLVSAAILNAQWFILFSKDRVDLRAGYYLWCASFFVLAVGSFINLQARRRIRGRQWE